MLNFNTYVVGFLFDIEKKFVVLIKKNRPDWQAGFLNGIGGRKEQYDPSVYQTMIREFKEETGVEIFEWEQFGLLTTKNHDSIFFFKHFTPMEKLMECKSMTDEQIIIRPIHNILSDQYGEPNVLPNLKWLIPLAIYDQNTTVLFK